MRTRFFALAALMLTGCFDFGADLTKCQMLGICASPTPIIKAGSLCSGDNWCWGTARPHNALSAVVSIDANHAWAFGDEGSALQYDGVSWTYVGGLTGALRSAIAFGPNDIYVAGPSLMHWDGTRWSGTNASGGFLAMGGVSGDDLWLAPDLSNASEGSLVHKLNGQFLIETLTGARTLALFAVSSNSVWAVGETGLVRHWNGSAWLDEAVGLTVADLNAVWAIGDDVWVAGDSGVVLRKSAGSWQLMPKQACPRFYAIAGTSADDVWFAGFGSDFSHWSNNTLKNVVVSDTKGTLAMAAGPAGLFAVGRGGRISQQVASSWRPVLDGTIENLVSVHGVAANDVWAVGTNGRTAHFDGETWTYETAGTAHLRGVFASSANVVWATDEQGNLHRRSDGAWKKAATINGSLLSVWASSETEAWAVGVGSSSEGFALHKTAAGAAPYPMPGMPALTAVFGVSDSDVWAVGDMGVVLHWNGSAWLDVPSGTTDLLTSVYVRGPDDVWVGGPNLVLHRVAGMWKRFGAPEAKIVNALADDGNAGVWLAARDGVLGRADAQGTAGQTSGTNVTLTGIWGAPNGVAFAVGDDGAILQRVPRR